MPNPVKRKVNFVSKINPFLARFAIIAASTSLAFTPMAYSQDGEQGIAFVQAIEQGSGNCFGTSPEDAFACATKKCAAESEYPEECQPMKWCSPAGWSADVFKQSKEGAHWHDYLCGWDSEEDLDAAIKVVCEGSAKEYLMECQVVTKWDRDGSIVPVQ